MTPQTLLIDGDILLYRFACTNAYAINWSEDSQSSVVDLGGAEFDTARFIERLAKKLHIAMEDVLIIFSGKNNFRYSVLPSYKHNRVGLTKPALYGHLKEFMVANYSTLEKDTLEGDDVMGIKATRSPGEYILATIDKDLQQIPGELYNWNTEIFKTITEEEADRYFYKQILMGDSGDGYSGCPGIGPKKAEKILESFLSGDQGVPGGPFNVWELIVLAYESRGLTEADALVQARVARILRAEDYDFQRKEIRLWQPPTGCMEPQPTALGKA